MRSDHDVRRAEMVGVQVGHAGPILHRHPLGPEIVELGVRLGHWTREYAVSADAGLSAENGRRARRRGRRCPCIRAVDTFAPT